MPIFGRFATHLQQLQKNKFENREFLKAEVAGSMGLSAVIALLFSCLCVLIIMEKYGNGSLNIKL